MEKNAAILNKVIAIILLFVFFTACNRDETARIKINIPENRSTKLTIEEQRVVGKKFVDSVYFSYNGKLSYKFELKQPTFYNLQFEGGNDLFILLSPKENVSITMDGNAYKIDGSEESQKLNYLYDSLFVSRKILNGLRQKYNLSIDEAYRDSISSEYKRVSKVYYRFSLQFILENLTSLASIAALYQEFSPGEYVFNHEKDLQFFKLVSDSLTKYYPKHRHVLTLKRNFGSMFEKYQVGKLFNAATVIEDKIPEIELPDIAGQIMKLTALKQRYVLLNFWSASNQSSRNLFPEMNTVFNKYKGKDFAIFNVYLGTSLSDWKRILKYEEIEKWNNVADTNSQNSRLQVMYNIQSLPANYLIDLQEQVFLSKDLNPRQLNQKLSTLLNN